MRTGEYQPKDIDDFERLLVANQDQSYLWIQYIAFMLDNIGVDAARKVAERALKSISMTNEQDKLNLWTAYMNLESNFGTQQTLETITKRALEVNDRKQVYQNLIDIYKSSKNFGFVEPIFKQLVKKYNNSLDIWSAYLEFLIDMRTNKKEAQLVSKNTEFSEPKSVLQKAL
jgi:rRNA biogenesis protein RRP5